MLSQFSCRSVDSFVPLSTFVINFRILQIIPAALTLSDFKADLVNANDLGGVNTDLKFFISVFEVKIILALFDMVSQSSADCEFSLIIKCAFSTGYLSVLAILFSNVW